MAVSLSKDKGVRIKEALLKKRYNSIYAVRDLIHSFEKRLEFKVT
ncbi:hypothetical protein BAC7755_42290 [Bacillus sp. MN7755]